MHYATLRIWVGLLASALVGCYAEQHARTEADASAPAAGVTRLRSTAKRAYGTQAVAPSIPVDGGPLAWPALAQPLLPIHAERSASDDRALIAALDELSGTPDWGHAPALEAFVNAHAASRWSAAVALTLGDVAYSVGRFSRALHWWKRAWDLAHDQRTQAAYAIANQALAEYAKMNARVGRQDEVRAALALAEGRVFQGDAAIKLDSAREGIWTMEHKPGVAFRCGPYALGNVLRVLSPEQAPRIGKFLRQVASPSQGFSLQQVAELAPRLGLAMQKVSRDPGSDVPVPSVVHWRVGHFAAIVELSAGKYRVQDPTFGNETWMTAESIDAESSGYFLIPQGPLPEGFRPVDSAEAGAVFGKGHSGTTDPDETGPDDQQDGGDDENCGMATYTFHTLLASLSVSDTPIRYAVARGPEVAFKVTYNQREASQPIAMTFTNWSPGWVSNWTSYLMDNPGNLSVNVSLRQRGGGGVVYTGYDADTQQFALHSQSKTRLRRLTPDTYVVDHADGSSDYYEHFIGTGGPARRVFLSRVVDPHGNEVALGYDPSMPERLLTIVDATGLTTTLQYDQPSQPFLVTSIQDPYGRRASFSYSDVDGTLRLTHIEDPQAIVSSFQYNAAGGMVALTTPYGTTRFELSPLKIGDSYALIRYIEATDPYGDKERIEYNLNNNDTGFANAAETYPDRTQIAFETGDLDDRNSFFWDKLQMRLAPKDYKAAHLYHWVQPDFADAALSIKESEKRPLEGRVWYNYEGQPATYVQGKYADPSAVGRVVIDPDGSVHTQVSRFAHNALGNVTRAIDPLGRETELIYASNEIDILELRQRAADGWQTLRRFQYEDAARAHAPTTITDASGSTTSLTYNAYGQPTSETNALAETTRYVYETDPTHNGYGKLIERSGAVHGGTVTLTYDAYDRIQTLASSDGYTLTFAYDALDRVTRIDYPDGSYEQAVYEHHRLVAERDRRGRWTHHKYNALRQLVATQDAQGRATQLEWCLCGEPRKLIDGSGNVTQWLRDLQGRVVERRFADATAIRYDYDYSGRTSASTDAAGRPVRFRYDLADALIAVDYGEATTPDVTFSYDPRYARLASRSDGVGTTRYSYHPNDGTTDGAGQLAFVDGPWPDDTQALTYDALGRPSSFRIVDDATRAVATYSQRLSYDDRGRTLALDDNLGTFRYTYAGDSNRVSSVSYPNAARTDYAYFDSTGDHLLQRIRHESAGASPRTLANFEYTYEPDWTVATWKIEASDGVATRWDLRYNDSLELVAARRSDESGALLDNLQYHYDRAGNRVQVDRPGEHHNYTVNPLNQLVAEQGFGPTLFTGTVNEPAAVTVAGRPAQLRSTRGSAPYTFEAQVDLAVGPNDIVVEATDGNGNQTTQTYSVSASGIHTLFEYDVHGNLRFLREPDGSVQREYRWDQENRLVGFLEGTHETRFSYDGLSHRTRKVELEAGVVRTDVTWLWCGARICEQRDAAGAAAFSRHFNYGLERAGAERAYYLTDHLGSIRQVLAADGQTLEAEYDYDVYGEASRTAGSGNPSFEQFTGHWLHAPSGALLAHHRAYDPQLGRWLSRDPLDERSGPNMYSYVHGDPIRYIDPDGAFAWIAAGAVIGAAINVGATYIANGGNVTGQQLAAAAVSGAISGALGAAAGPLGGTIARGLGAASNGLVASVAASALSAGAGAAGQAAANLIDPCHAGSVANAALAGGLGGGLSKHFFPTRNLNTWAQARAFGPTTLGGLVASRNAALNSGGFATSSAVGAASNFFP